MIPLVTSINRAYLPGLKALANSFHANAGDKFTLFCIVHGDKELFSEVADLGVLAYHPTDWAEQYPTSGRWPDTCPAMYSRLQIPSYCSGVKKAVWIDADCVITQSLDELAEIDFDEPIAAIQYLNDRYTLNFHIPEIESKVNVPFSGLIVFNIPKWHELELSQKCREIMRRDDLTFEFAVQSVLALAVKDNYFPLDHKWQAFANRKTIPNDARILHWVGGLPWRDEMNNKHIWQEYA